MSRLRASSLLSEVRRVETGAVSSSAPLGEQLSLSFAFADSV